MTPFPSRRSQSGLTLIELIIVMVVLGVLSVLGSTMFVDTFNTVRIVDATQSSANQARYAMERLTREFREVKYDSVALTYSITSLSSPPSSATFTNVLNGTDQAVTVDLSGTDLRLSYGTPFVLCPNVSAFTVTYLDLNGNATTSTANVRFVVISLTVTDPTSGQVVGQRTRVGLRNAG